MTAILELNDFELTLYQNSERLYHAPAMAIVRDRDLSFGEAARREFRLFPRQANQQYFAKLNAEPLSQPSRAATNNADLVYLHLKELQQLCDDQLVVAVPGNLSGDQLGVLLGIAQEAGFTIRGFVDSAVAALAENAAPAAVFYLDIHLQHSVLTELSVADEVQRVRAEEIRDCGVSNLVDGWVNVITDRFVSKTRFDPLHTADTEQQLYNQVHDWLHGAHLLPELSVVIAHGGSERSVEVPLSDLEAKAQQRYRKILDVLPAAAHLMISARTAKVPGLARALKNAGHTVEPLTANAVGDGVRRNLAAIVGDGEQLRLINSLPHEHDAPLTAVTVMPVEMVTHLLDGHTAFALNDHSTLQYEERGGETWLLPGTEVSLNGRTLEQATRLQPGDVIADGSRSLTAISVES